MFWKFVLMEEYSLIILFFTTSSVIGKQRLSFIVQMMAILIGIRCLIRAFRIVSVGTVPCYHLYRNLVSSKRKYEDEAIEGYLKIATKCLRDFTFCLVLYCFGFLIPNLLPIGNISDREIFNLLRSPKIMNMLVFLYVFLIFNRIYNEISLYLICDAYMYFDKHLTFSIDKLPRAYRKFYDYYTDNGCAPHTAIKKTAVFRISFSFLPLIGIIIACVIR